MKMKADGRLWDIDEGIEDASRFFSVLARLFPDATHLFVEGTRIARDVSDCYRRYADPGPYLLRRQTIWPISSRHRCAVSPEFFEELAGLSRGRRSSEVLDHLALYQEERMILEWHDAFANAILLDGSLPEATVAELARSFGLGYGRV